MYRKTQCTEIESKLYYKNVKTQITCQFSNRHKTYVIYKIILPITHCYIRLF